MTHSITLKIENEFGIKKTVFHIKLTRSYVVLGVFKALYVSIFALYTPNKPSLPISTLAFASLGTILLKRNPNLANLRLLPPPPQAYFPILFCYISKYFMNPLPPPPLPGLSNKRTIPNEIGVELDRLA